MMVAGERSGDICGAELAPALRARLNNAEIFGCGGEAMRLAGVDTVVDAHQLTMIGITEIVSGLPRAYRAFHALLEEVDRRRPQLAVLIDFPDFNLRLAKQLKKRRIRVVYFVSPQVWAWRKSRLKQLKARIDKMLCIFDFEEAIYREAGIPVEYVGHPLVDLVRPQMTREHFFAQTGLDPSTTTVALLPGSREKEVSNILPTMLEAAHRLSLTHKVQFVVAVAPTLDAQWLEKAVLECHAGKATVRAATHATYDALSIAKWPSWPAAQPRSKRPCWSGPWWWFIASRRSPGGSASCLSMSPFTVWSILLPESRWFPNSFRVISLRRTSPVG